MPSHYTEGQTATNPDTGERWIFKNGAWEAVHPLSEPFVEAEVKGQPHPYMSMLTPEQRDFDVSLSVEDLIDAIPGLGGAVGAAAGGIGASPTGPGALATGAGGAALGAAGGESIRQLIRRAAGLPAATGVTQEVMGLDPESSGAAAAGIAGEAATGGLFELLGPVLRAAGGKLTKSAKRAFAKAISQDASEREIPEIIRTLETIEKNTPTGVHVPLERGASRLSPAAGPARPEPGLKAPITRGRIERMARDIQDVEIERVREAFGKDTPVGDVYGDVGEALKRRMKEQERTPAFPRRKLVTEDTGLVDPEGLPITKKSLVETVETPSYRREEYVSGLKGEAKKIEKARKARVLAEEEGAIRKYSVSDLWEDKKAADEVANWARKPFRKKGPGEKAKLDTAKAFREALYERAEKKGVKASKRLGAALTVEELAGGAASPATFMQRWVPSRLIPGRTGTAIGALAALPRLYHAFGWKGKTLLARAVSAGDDPMVRQIIRTAADVWLQDNPDDEEVRKHLEAINEEAR